MSKKYRLHIPVGELFSFFGISDEGEYEINRHLNIKTPTNEYKPIRFLVKKKGFVKQYFLKNGISIKCDKHHLVKNETGKFYHIDECKTVHTTCGLIDVINSINIGEQSVYDFSMDDPHEYVTLSGIICHNTTASKMISKSIDCDCLYINASDIRKVDEITEKVRGFIGSVGFKKWKVVVLDEVDGVSSTTQSMLRNLLEMYSHSTRFILTCNYVEKIISPVVSRCQVFEVIPPSKKDIAIHLSNILNKESIGFTKENIAFLVNSYYPDIRKIINASQQSVVDGKLSIDQNSVIENDAKLKMIELLKTSTDKKDTFNKIRQLIADNKTSDYTEWFSCLYSHVDEFGKNSVANTIICIANGQYQASLVADREISFMACIIEILKCIHKE